MQIDEIIWLQSIVDKLERKHHVSQNEVEQIFVNNPQYRFLEKGKIEVNTYIRHMVKPMPVVM
jgi:hypothetical protein